MFTRLMRLRTTVLAKVEKLGWLGPLLARFAVGMVFIGTGWGKLHSLDQVTSFFTELHIPAPHLQAVVVASTEFLGGLCIVFGLFTRLAALPLAFTMIIAIVTAKRSEIDGLTTLLGFNESLYLVVFLWLAIVGAGKLSLDHLLSRRLRAPAIPAL